MKTTMNRRAFLSGAAALGVGAHPDMAGVAAESNAGRGSFKLPARGEFMFAIMKAIQNVENSRTENEFKLPARRVLELATIEGARSMGVDDRVGSLKPGKRADLIMVSTRDVNIGVFTDPAHMLVEAAQPSNVDTVVVDGRILKRRGKLTAIDTRQVVGQASVALTGVRKRGNWW